MAYSFTSAITIDHTKCGSANSTNFPFLFSGTYSWLATVANGGSVTSSNGYDIVFSSDAGGSTLLSFERVSYNAVTGNVEFWVKVPTISSSVDTVIYILYGNSAITTDQQAATSVWDSNFKFVAHLSDAAGAATIADSTGLNTLTTSGSGTSNPVTGQVGSGIQFTNFHIGASNPSRVGLPTGHNPLTLEAWLKIPSGGTAAGEAVGWGDNSTNGRIAIYWNNDNKLYAECGATSRNIPFTPDGNWHHFVIVMPSGGSLLSNLLLYLDGALTTSAGDTTSTLGISSAGDLTLNAIPAVHSAPFNQPMDEVRGSATDRSASWILTGYNNQKSPSTFYSVAVTVPTSYTNELGSGTNRERSIAINTTGAFNTAINCVLLVDGNTSGTGLFFTGSAASAYAIVFDFGADKYVIDEAKWYQSDGTAQGTWKWQGSNDGSTWADIGGSFTLGGVATQTQTSLNGNATAYRQYRLLGLSGSVSSGPWLYEIQFKISLVQNRSNGTSYLSSLGSGNRTSLVSVAVAGSPAYTNGTPSTAVDGSFLNTNFWINNPTTAGNTITFDVGSSLLVDEIALWYNGGSNGTWKWQGSTNNSTWTDLGSSFTLVSSSITPCLQMRSINGNTTPYRYYRMLCVTGASFTSDGNIQEVEFRIVENQRLNVTKANAFAVLTTPTGVAVTKTIGYAVLTTPAGLAVPKTSAYAVLSTSVSIQQPIIFIST